MKLIKEIIKDNEELIIPLTTKKFLLGCCKCGLTNQITIKRKNGEIILKFKRIK